MMSSADALVAVVGHPNCGKTALFNALTGLNQKVANYPGVTVERVEAVMKVGSASRVRLLDLPGVYSLNPKSEDEQVTHDVLVGHLHREVSPSALLLVLDVTSLRAQLPLALELKELGISMCVALNMMDLVDDSGMEIDVDALAKSLNCEVIAISAKNGRGLSDLAECISRNSHETVRSATSEWTPSTREMIIERRRKVEDILRGSILRPGHPSRLTTQLDQLFLHPVLGPAALLCIIFLVFQAVFTLGALPTDFIDELITNAASWLRTLLAPGLLADLLVDGIVAGVGAVLVFLPQILILFACLLALEDSGYMARAAFLMDRLMGRVGLSGRSVLPMVSGFACAIPAIYGARSIQSSAQRLITILITPLMTCSARLPVYTLLISAFIPAHMIAGGINLQGVVLTALYIGGGLSAFVFAWILKKAKIASGGQYFLLELPKYHIPSLRNVVRGLLERARAFLTRAGTMILSIMVVLWAISTFPRPPEGYPNSPIEYSIAGRLGKAVAPVLEPLGFDWKVSVAMIPGFAAREVLVSALGTVYAVESDNETALSDRLKADWTLPTALSLLVWYVFAPQCLATFAVMQRETRSWRWTLLSFFSLLIVAWFAAYMTFNLAGALL